ncbi:Hydroquinone glucosyltransferase, partial [Bienertia sinuspersici]
IRDSLRVLSGSTQLVAFVVDLFGFQLLHLAHEFGLYPYLFYPSNALAFCSAVSLKKLDETNTCEFKDIKKQVHLYPGLVPVHGSVSIGESEGSHCIKWLDEQTSNSALFVSFGSGGNLSLVQLIELALGLEMSCQRFLWVVKAPQNKADASVFGINNIDDPIEFLPQGFLDRTKVLGLVVPSWVPQIQILSHNSIGRFLIHCGWNSILENIVNDVPLIAWPLYAKQRLNPVLVEKDNKVANEMKPNDKGLVQIAQFAQCLIQGEQGKELRENMRVLKHA